MPLHRARPRASDEEYLEVRPEFASDLATRPLPRLRLPEHATAPRVAYQLVHDELLLDGNPRLNLATFVTTWMEPEARALMRASVDRNLRSLRADLRRLAAAGVRLSPARRRRGLLRLRRVRGGAQGGVDRPRYTMPQGLEHVHVLRVVVRNGVGRDLAHTFMGDLGRAVKDLEAGEARVAADGRAGFHH